jgi:uncharacterized repeat protein (TIGR02543 family)
VNGKSAIETDADCLPDKPEITLYKHWTPVPAGQEGSAKVFFHPYDQVENSPEYARILQGNYNTLGYPATADLMTYRELLPDLDSTPQRWDLAGTCAGWTWQGWKVEIIDKMTSERVLVRNHGEGDNRDVNYPENTFAVLHRNDTVWLPSSESLEVHLYGTWSQDKVTITRNTRGGTPMEAIEIDREIETYLLDESSTTLGAPTRAGYIFAGWASFDPAAKKTASLNWEENVWGDITKSGKPVKTWNVDNLLQVQNSRNLIVYAVWHRDPNHKVKLIFDAQGGIVPDGETPDLLKTDGMPGDQSYTLVTAGNKVNDGSTFEAPTTAKAGYSWDGNWYTLPVGGEVISDWANYIVEAENADSAGSNVDPVRRVYAHWKTLNEGTDVYWHGVGGFYVEGSDKKSMINWYGLDAGILFQEAWQYSNVKFPDKDGLPLFTRAGYEFIGWYTTANYAENTQIHQNSPIEPQYTLSGDPSSAVEELYARWQPALNSVAIAYDYAGGVRKNDSATSQVPTKNVTPADDRAIPAIDSPYSKWAADEFAPGYLMRAGWEFDGWYYDDAKVTGDDPVVPHADAPTVQFGGDTESYVLITLKARWKIASTPVLVTWRANRFTDDSESQDERKRAGDVLYAAFAPPGKKFINPGYELIGWSSSDLRTLDAAGNQVAPANNATSWPAGQTWFYTVSPRFTDTFSGRPLELLPNIALDSSSNVFHVQLNAQWQAVDPQIDPDNAVLLKFDVNGGTALLRTEYPVQAGAKYSDSFPKSFEFDFGVRDSESITPHTARAGYAFKGWERYNGDDLTTPVATYDGNNNDEVIQPSYESREIYFKAVWKAITGGVTILYETNNGTPVEKVTATAGEAYGALVGVSLSTRPGFVLEGWYLDETLVNQVTAADFVTPAPESNVITLYAKWAPRVQVQLRFDEQNKTRAVAVDYTETLIKDDKGDVLTWDVTAGDTYGSLRPKRLLPEPVRKGYKFLGWHTRRQVFRAEEDSQWLVEDADDVEPQSFIHESVVRENSTTISLSGFQNKDEEFFLTSINQYKKGGVVLTLFAHWEPEKYGVTVNFLYEPYSLLFSTVALANEDRTNNPTAVLDGPGAVPVQYRVTVDGFYGYDDQHPSEVNWLFPYPKEQADMPTISGTGNLADWYDLRLPVAQLPGYSFEGWFLERHKFGENDPPLSPQDVLEQITEDTPVYLPDPDDNLINLYAHFQPQNAGQAVNLHPTYEDDDTIAITYGGNTYSYTGAEKSNWSLKLTHEQLYYTENLQYASPVLLGDVVPTRDGYNFDGWYTSEEAAKTRRESDRIKGDSKHEDGTPPHFTDKNADEWYLSSESAHTLYAAWRPDSEIILSFVNPVGPNPPQRTVAFDAPYGSLPDPSVPGTDYYVPGYVFKGWYDAPSGGNLVTEADIVKNPKDHTLYARMEGASIKVAFVPQGGKVDPAEKEVVFALAYGALPAPLRDGYKFLGWYTAPDAEKDKGQWINAKTEVTNPESHKVYAQWQALTDLKVIFDPVRGTVAPGMKSVAFDQPYGTLPLPVRPGYVFVGWYTDEEGGFLIEDYVPVKTSSAHVLYAHWHALPTPPVIIPVVIDSGSSGGDVYNNLTNVIVIYNCDCGTCDGSGPCGCASCPNRSDPTDPQYPGNDPSYSGNQGLVPGGYNPPPPTGENYTVAIIAAVLLGAAVTGCVIVTVRKRKDDE